VSRGDLNAGSLEQPYWIGTRMIWNLLQVAGLTAVDEVSVDVHACDVTGPSNNGSDR
jgi:hypothetical protein